MAGQTIQVSVLADTKPFSKAMSSVGGAIGGITKVAAGAAAGIAAAIGGIAIAGGFARALNIDEAQTKLKALGYDAKATAGIMDSALASVRGTAFGLGDAATLASQALAAGIPQGEGLTKALTLVTNTAALAGTSLGDMGSIFAKIWTSGRAQTTELNQLADRGIPIWTTLAEAQGVTVDELRKMVSAGQVTAQMFESALGPAVEGVAGTMGTSFRGMAANLVAALGRIGAIFAGPLLEAAKPWIGALTSGIDVIAGKLAPLGEAFGSFLSGLKPPDLSSFSLTGILDGLLSAREAIVDAALNALTGILDAATTIIPKVIESTAQLITKVVSYLGANGPTLLAGAVTLFTSLLDAVVQILPGLITQIAAMLPVIVSAILGMLPALLNAATQAFTAIVEALPVVIPIVVTTLVALIPTILSAILDAIPAILDAAVSLFTGIVDALPVVIPLVLSALITLIPQLITTLVSALPRILEAAIRLFTGIVTAIPKILPELIPAILRLIPEIIGALISAVPQLVQAGIDLIAGLVTGLWQAASSVGAALLDIIGGAVDGFLAFLGINSPSRLFAGYGQNVGQGLAIGIGRSTRDVARAMSGLNATVGDGFDTSLSLDASASLSRAPQATRTATANGDVFMVELSPADRMLLEQLGDARIVLNVDGREIARANRGQTASDQRRGKG